MYQDHRRRAVFVLLLGVVLHCAAQDSDSLLPSLREQAQIQQDWLRLRLENVLPRLMRENNVAMWIVPMREYNEDPVFSSFVSATTFSARRRTIYVFFDPGPAKPIERIALGGGSQGGLYTAYRDTSLGNAELWGDDQWKLLASLVRSKNPKTIAVNISHIHAFSDGLTAGEWELLRDALGPGLSTRIVRTDRLALDYIAIRVPEMLPTYKRLMTVAHAIIMEAFSGKVIIPGKTTTDDVVWWMREKVRRLGLMTWFQPSVDIQRRGYVPGSPLDPTIQRGDVLHCDFGLTAMRLNTDSQYMGYVLRDGEQDAPPGIKMALQNSNRLQDIVKSNMNVGLTGNQILTKALKEMKAEGIDGTVYTHAIGEHGHGAGALIGLWDRQMGVPGRGDVPLIPNTWYSIELQATTPVPEWDGQKVQSAQEEDVEVATDGRCRWILERQTQFLIIRL